jgi:hypothetical protein
MRRAPVTAAVLASAAILAGCAGSPTLPHHHGSGFTLADGIKACNAVSAWLPKASNSAGSGEQFTPAMERYETLAGTSQLGMALRQMDDDDQPGNYTGG